MSAQVKKEMNAGESVPFSAEISKVLKLMIHSLYTNRDIFLRELISNASDACDKLRYNALQDDSLMQDQPTLGISVRFNEEARTVSITDTGIGMNRQDMIDHLGTIARSGTEQFVQQLSEKPAGEMNLIGQFGVGFYSAFMVADRVEVISRKAGEAESWRWASDGEGSFDIGPADDAPRGTTITLYLKEDAAEFADLFKLKFIIQTYSDHISFPIDLGEEGKDVEQVNTASAIWARPKSEITDEQYEEFYHHVSHSPDSPFLTLHQKAEGMIEYTSLLYVPTMKPFDLFHPERRRRVKLYVKRVFITDENVDLIPAWLRFLRGVVDSEDLPLNISRENLQDNPLMAKIRQSITGKVLSSLKQKAEKEPEAYAGFWKNFGGVLKEGLCEPAAPVDKLLEVCRFATTHGEALTGLQDYVARMREGQQAIYIINGDDEEQLRHSPQLEGFKKHGIEVLLLTDQVDDFWLNLNHQFADKPFRSVLRYGSDLDAFAGNKTDEEAKDEAAKEEDADCAALISVMKDVYGEAVREVRTTHKLSESPVCLAVGEGDMDLRMERFLLEHKQIPAGAARILEINPQHPVIRWMAAHSDERAQMEELSHLLLDQARIQEGEQLKDPAAFSRRMSELLVTSLNARTSDGGVC
jgi:molecular chaperone HtpG